MFLVTTAQRSIDAALVVSALNILLSADRVRDLFDLRMVSRMTRRRSFPVPGYPLIELPTGPVEEMLVGHGCGVVSFVVVVRAMYLHREIAAAEAATALAAAGESRRSRH